MKIDGFGPGGKVGKASKKAKSSKASKAKGAKTGANVAAASANGGADKLGAPDSVEVSSHSETLDMIRGLVNDTPDIRVDEVERIVSEMKAGKFKINFESVAEGFIKEAIINEMAKKKKFTN